jgi:hypothetical protein
MRYYFYLIFSLAIAGILIYLNTAVPDPRAIFRPESVVTEFSGLATSTIDVLEVLGPELVTEETRESEAAESIIEEPEQRPLAENLFTTKPEAVSEKEIDIRAIVLIRCLFQTQFYSESSQPWNEQQYNVGSGVIVSLEGHILTTRHILNPREEMLNDPAGRVWERRYCEVAMTSEDQGEISMSAGDLFKRAEIAYSPSKDQYKDSAGLDFSILKISSEKPLPYSPIFPRIVSLAESAPIIAIGYPGREISSSQKLERFDGQFSGFTYYEESSCDGTITPCGIRYFLKRYPYDYEKDFWKQTSLGIITPYFRGGFSGAPIFYRGNLIGVITHGLSGDYTKSGWDEAFALASYDIFETIKELNIVSDSDQY